MTTSSVYTSTMDRVGVGPMLSTLWVYVLLSNLHRDVHEFLREGFISELATSGTVAGEIVTSGTLVISGLVLQLPLAMVVLARILPERVNRVANILVAAVVGLGLLAIWPKDGDDLIFGFFQLVGLLAIAVISVRSLSGRGEGTRA